MISLLKNIFPAIPIILGGIYPTLLPNHAKKVSGADMIVVGEGEIRGLQIVNEITGHHSDLHDYQEWDHFPMASYHLYERLDSVALLTSRGCPYRCPFCASHILSGKYQRRHPALVVKEIEFLFREKGVSHFAFYDDALLSEKEVHLIPILEEICKKEIRIHFHTPNGIQPREIDSELANLMYRVGFQTIRLSYESSYKERQQSMGMKVQNTDLTRAVQVLLNSGFGRQDLGCYVLMGLPGQEFGEVLESMIFVLKHGIKVSLASFSPIPGTPYWDDAVKQGLISADTDPLLTNNSIFPLRSNHFNYDVFIRLGTLAGIANRVVNQNGLPLAHPDFVRPFNKLPKAYC